MVVYFLDKNTLEIKDVVNASKFNLKFDEETNATSNITFHRKPNANQNDFIVVKKANATKYQGIISEIQGEKKSNQVEVICKDISNLFNRKIYVDGETYMEISLEDFLYYNINKFFKQGDDDSKTAMPYLSIVQSTQTSVTEPINDEDGIYNFHTFMTNCRQNKNISVNFKIKQEEIVVTIENIGNQDVVKIDTTNNDVIKYNKVYEMNITSKVIVKCGDTGNILNYYLLTDRTITTDKTNVNRASGDINTIYVDEEEKAYEQAVNIFKGNRYNHLVEFEIKQDSKLVDTDELTIGRPIKIKTNDGILESYISSIEIEEKSNYIKYKSGNIRVDLIDKLKQEPYKIGINKLDKASIKSSLSSGIDKTYSCDYLNPNIITIEYGRYTFNTSQWVSNKITHSSLLKKLGDKLSYSNDSIIIGEGVSAVKISALVSTGGSSRTGDYGMEIHKISNSVDAMLASSYENGTHYYFPSSIPDKLIDVSPGDVLYVTTVYSFGGSFTIEVLSGHLTVEVVQQENKNGENV